MIATLLAVIPFAGVSPAAVSAAGPTTIATSSAPKAFQHSAEDKVAYLHDGSLLVGYYDNNNHAIIDHITTPSTTPVSTQVDSITGGSEISFYTLPSTNSTEVWIATGSELTGGLLKEQVQYGTYNGSTFSWHAVATVPGSLTSGRQDPTVTWTGKWLITSWWDDTMGGNSDSVFMNWTTDRTGAGGWISKYGTTSAITGKNGTTAAATIVTATTITYNNVTGGAPVTGVYVFGYGTVNSEVDTVTAVSVGPAPYTLTLATPLGHPHGIGEVDTLQTWTITYAAVTGGAPLTGDWYQFGDGANAEYRQVTVTGSGPYMLAIAGLANLHATGEVDTQEATIQLTTVGQAIVQVSIRHSAKLGATIAIYGARSHLYTRTLLDGATNPSIGNWTGETLVDPLADDSEAGFGGPQIAIDETTGKIHVFRAVTNHGGASYHGVNYWLGTPDATPMVSGSVSWNARLPIDTAAGPTDPPDIAGTVDSAGRVYIFWTTTAIAGAIKYVTLVSPFTSFSPAVTVATTGTQPRFPHVPAQAPLQGTFVPLVYEDQSGTGPFSIVLDTSVTTTSACLGTPLFTSYFSWFDKASTGMVNDNIHLLNTGGSTSIGCVRLGAQAVAFSLAPGQETYATFPFGAIGGPVTVEVTSGPAVLASQRVHYYQSFNEVWAMSPSQAATTSYLSWFDKATTGMLNDNIHVLNPGTAGANVTVSMPGATSINFALAAGAETYATFPSGTIGGPVTVSSDQPVLASQRVQYYQTFNEVVARSAAQATLTSYFNWFDKASTGMLNDNVHLLNTSASSANVTVSLTGANPIALSVAAGAETYVTFPKGTIGGPITVSSDQPVLSSQRVQYFQSFNETPSESAAQAQTTSHIMWFDKASTGMFNDNIHLLNPGLTSATVTVTLLGAPTQTVTVPAGAEAYVTFPVGTIGGPVTISASQPVLASQRVQYYSSFNELWAG